MIELFKKHAAKSELENDFSEFMYIVNHQQRAVQVSMTIAGEMKDENIKTIIPPEISSYPIAFLNIANEILKKSWSKGSATEYSEEWEEFLMYEIATELVKSGESGKLNRVENRRRALVRDTKDFIRSVVMYEKWDEVEKLEKKFNKDEPEYLFIQFYNKYVERAKKYEGTRFFDIYDAYRQLYEYLKKGGKVEFSRVLMVEDYDDMEPVFRSICEMLKKSGVKVSRYLSLPAAGSGKRKDKACKRIFAGFMTPLDEAEYIGFSIKEMVSEGVKPHEISIISYSSKTSDLLRFVFDRFRIAYTSAEKIAQSAAFELLRSSVYMVNGLGGMSEHVYAMLSNEYSAFRLSNHSLFEFKRRLNEKGYIIYKNPDKAVLSALDETVKARKKISEEYEGKEKEFVVKIIEDDIRKMKSIIKFASKTESHTVSGIFGKVFLPSSFKNTSLLVALSGSVEIIDRMMESHKDKESTDDYRFLLESLMNIVGGREFMAFNDPVDEARLFKGESVEEEVLDSGYAISLLNPAQANNTGCKEVFLCGMDASMDKREGISYPHALGSVLDLPLPDGKKKEKYSKFDAVFSSYPGARLSYAYLDTSGKVMGISNAARIITSGGYDLDIIENEDKSLLRSYDIIDKKDKAPDESYRSYPENIENAKTFSYEKGKDKLFEQTSILDMLPEKNGRKVLSVSRLVEYVMCPRKFAYGLIADRAGLRKTEMKQRAGQKRGDFWHEVFRMAAENREFNEPDAEKIASAVEKAYEKVISTKEYDLDSLEERHAADIDDEARKYIIPLFAENEAMRKKNLAGIRSEAVEKKMTFDAGGFILEGRPDRIDSSGSLMAVWDYKTGKNNRESFFLLSDAKRFVKNSDGKTPKFNSKNGAYAVQLGIYLFLLHNNRGQKPNELQEIIAGIIYRDGSDNIEDMEILKQQYRHVIPLAGTVLESFSEFSKITIYDAESEKYSSTPFISGGCKYCNFTDHCQALAMGGNVYDR